MLKEQIAELLKNQSKEHSFFTLGASFGHFLVHANDLTAVSFDGDDGIESLLEYMVRNDWEGIFEEENLIGVRKYPATVWVQAGGQIQLEVAKTSSLQVIDKTYLNFIQELVGELEARGQILLASGFQPVTKVDDITLVPMAKAKHMAEYLQDNHSAMQLLKGAAHTTVTLDYAHSDDFEKKYRVATMIAPMLVALFDNIPVLDGEEYEKFAASIYLWDHADAKISHLDNIMDDRNFKFNRYGQFISKAPAIAISKEDEVLYVGNKSNEEIFGEKPLSEDELFGRLEMVEPEIKTTTNGIELRMVDGLPYPLNMAYIALIKGIFYNVDNINSIYELSLSFQSEDIKKVREEVVEKGLDAKFGEASLRETAKDLYFLATPQLLPQEQHYTQPLDTLIFKNISPKNVAKKQLLALKHDLA